MKWEHDRHVGWSDRTEMNGMTSHEKIVWKDHFHKRTTSVLYWKSFISKCTQKKLLKKLSYAGYSNVSVGILHLVLSATFCGVGNENKKESNSHFAKLIKIPWPSRMVSEGKPFSQCTVKFPKPKSSCITCVQVEIINHNWVIINTYTWICGPSSKF